MTLASRSTDPSTSREAAKSHEDVAASNRHLLLAAVKLRNGSTSGELARLAGLDRVEAARRLPEMERHGSVARGLARVCDVCGTKQMTWWTT